MKQKIYPKCFFTTPEQIYSKKNLASQKEEMRKMNEFFNQNVFLHDNWKTLDFGGETMRAPPKLILARPIFFAIADFNKKREMSKSIYLMHVPTSSFPPTAASMYV